MEIYCCSRLGTGSLKMIKYFPRLYREHCCSLLSLCCYTLFKLICYQKVFVTFYLYIRFKANLCGISNIILPTQCLITCSYFNILVFFSLNYWTSKVACEYICLFFFKIGSYAGTPLHHAAKKGCEQTVHLLLSYGGQLYCYYFMFFFFFFSLAMLAWWLEFLYKYHSKSFGL